MEKEVVFTNENKYMKRGSSYLEEHVSSAGSPSSTSTLASPAVTVIKPPSSSPPLFAAKGSIK